MSNESMDWVQAQKKTFENWVNDSIKDRNVQISDLKVDLKTGTNLYELYRELTGKTIKHVDMKPKIKISYLQNLNCIIEAFKKDKVKIVNVQGEDIYEENLKLILGFIWMLIQHYHILGSGGKRSSSSGAKKLILDFVNKIVEDRKVKNFKGDWKDGEVLSMLINGVEPGVYPKEARPEDPKEKVEKALQTAEEQMGIPKVIESDYIVNAVDELSLMTYTTYLKKKYEENLMKIEPGKCIAYGKGLENNHNSESPYDFTVELRNKYDLICSIVLEENALKDIDVNFTGPSPVQYNAVLKEPGIYSVSYEAVHPGDYVIDVKICNERVSIKESPFNVKIEESPQNFTGNGLENGEYTEGQKLEILIDSGIKSGGLVQEKEIEIMVTAPSGTEIPLEKEDYENGKYAVFYSPKERGLHTVSIDVFGKNALDKKVDLKKKGSSVTINPEMSSLTGPDKGRAGTKIVLELKAVDDEGNPVMDLMKDWKPLPETFEMELNPPCNYSMSERDGGVYSVEVDAEEEGTLEVGTVIGEKRPERCQKKIQILPRLPEKILVDVSGEIVDKKRFPNNRATGLVVRVLDGERKPVGDVDVDVDVKDSDGKEVGSIQVNEAENGDHQVNIDSVEKKGSYQIDVKVEEQPTQSFTADCVEGTQPEIVEGTFTFEIHARDTKGELKTVGGDKWEVKINGPKDSEIEVDTKDLGDGRYSATYHLQAIEGKSSTFKVNALLDGKHVASSPFTHQLAPKPSIGQRLKNFFL